MKKIFTARNVIFFVLFTFILSILYTIVKIVLSPGVANDASIRVKSDYVLMLLQCIVGVIAILSLGFLKRKVKLNISSAMMIVYAVFLYCAIYLGEVRNFYYIVPNWDTFLHTFSGAALGALGFSLVSLLNKSPSLPCRLSPFFVALFAFCFALALGVVWEIYEFTIDTIFHTNMQKFMLESGEQLIGQAALRDTMKDLIVDTLGALGVSTAGFFSLKSRKGWLGNACVIDDGGKTPKP